MSKRAWFGIALLASPVAGAAQSIETLVADSVRLTEAAARWRVRDSVSKAHRQVSIGSTITAGLFTIVSPDPVAEVVTAGAEATSRHLRAAYGDALDGLVRAQQWQVRWDTLGRRATFTELVLRRDGKRRYMLDRLDAGRIAATDFLGTTPTATRVAEILELHVRDAYASRMDSAFRTLAGGPPRLLPAPRALWTDVNRYSTLGAAVNRRCLAGALRDCASAMGLQLPADRMAVWFDAADLPNFFRSLNSMDVGYVRTRAGADTYDACVRGSFAACSRMTRFVNPEHVSAPMPTMARALLVRLALEMGGGAGMKRLDAARGKPIPEQVAALAGQPFDSVLSQWRQRVVNAHPRSGTPDATFTLASLAWLAALLALSTRGAPWRR